MKITPPLSFLKKLNLNKYLKKAKISVIVATLPLLFATPLPANAATELDRINAQINSLSKQIETKRAQKNSLENEIAIIDARMAQINLQISASQKEIEMLTSEIHQTNQQIIQKESELKAERKKMAEYLRVMYEEEQTSIIEQVVKADTFSDFVDQKEYLSTMQLKIKETADRILAIKKELEQKKASLTAKKKKTEELKAAQVAQKNAQAAQKAYKDSLLSQIRNQEASMQGQLNNLHARKAAMSISYGERVFAGSSRYPYGNPPPRHLIDRPDPWGYLIGECTSYVAWKRTTIGKPVPRGLGNANTWGSRAAGMGLSVNRSPRPGDVMVMPYVGGYGHVAFVEAVYGNGNILISEYNWSPFSYSTRTVNPWNYGGLFIH